MKYYSIKETDMQISCLAMGCMHLCELDVQKARKLIDAALELGINFFDHADIYGGGQSEKIFAEAVNQGGYKREDMIIQSKCGIVTQPGKNSYYDFSRGHILASVDGILGRLNTDYIDVLLLHRPDALAEPEEVAEAFNLLEAQGKVRYFGVSNQNPAQMRLFKQALKQKLVFNQLQFSMAHTLMIDQGMTVNMNIAQSFDRDGGILDYCRLNDITVQAWSPFQKGFFDGPFLGDDKDYAGLNEMIDEIAQKYNVTNTAIAVAWILRHPANIQVVTGTTKPQRLRDAADGSDIELTRAEWYGLYAAAGNSIP